MREGAEGARDVTMVRSYGGICPSACINFIYSRFPPLNNFLIDRFLRLLYIPGNSIWREAAYVLVEHEHLAFRNLATKAFNLTTVGRSRGVFVPRLGQF